MATYKKEKGFAVQTLSSDTAASVAASGSWASAASLNATIREGGGAGTSTSAINVGGYPYPMTNEQWNGSTWATFANLGTARGKNAVAGNYTNAIAGNGSTPGTPGIGIINNVETWNGSSWSEVAEINTIRDANGMSASGTNTATIYFGGNASPGKQALNESWNGSAWTEVNDLNTARSTLAGVGTTTAALAVGGDTGSKSALNESWNGSAWTEVGDLNTARSNISAASNTSTDTLAFAGNTPPITAKTESWDGTSWTEVGDLGTARENAKGAGPSGAAAICFGGNTPPATTATEEWTTTPAANLTKINLGQVYFNSTSNAFKVTAQSVVTGAWSAGGDLNTARSAAMGAGAQTAGIVVAGFTPPGYQPVSAITEQYNGSSWTEVGDLNEGTSSGGIAHNSPYADTVRYGGNGNTDKTETWNNSSWTAVGDLNTGRIGGSGYGSSSSSAGYAGGDPVSSNINETWDGSSWTEVGNLNSARRYGGGTGTVTAALVIAGDTDVPGFPGGRYTARVESWDGSSFTEVGDLNTGGAYRGTSGTQTQAIAFGGGSPSPYQTITESWNGTSWTEVADLANARRAWASGIGTAAGAGLAAGGEGPSSNLDATEEFTAATANSTITLS